jgi:ubiquinone/menaquinone biosynthesis C-methylase UbiE
MKMGKIEKSFVNSPSHSQRISRHAENLLRYANVKPGQRYLNVGCGNGAAPIHIAQTFGLHVTGVDIDPEQIQLAEASSRGLANLRFMTVDGTQLPFEDEEFDIVATNKVMHHIPNWEAAVAEMARVLEPGGYFIYSDFVYPGPIAALGKSLVGNMGGFPTRKALDSMVKRNNLEAIRLSASPFHYEGVFRKMSLL